MFYRIITGYYPTEKSALKVLQNVRGKYAGAELRHSLGYWFVVVKECENFPEAMALKDEFLKRGIYCGVEVYENTFD